MVLGGSSGIAFVFVFFFFCIKEKDYAVPQNFSVAQMCLNVYE